MTQDAKSVAEFIRIWLGENGRWNSPKYLGGESYGTTRSAAVVNQLEGAYNDVSLNGIILISTILDFGGQAFVPGNEMPYVLYPAVDGGRRLPPRQGARRRRHARGLRPGGAGLRGRRLCGGADQGAEAAGRGARRDPPPPRPLHRPHRALPRRFADLRVSDNRFYKELLRDRGLVVGRLDARYTGRDYDNAGEAPDNDPSFYGIDAGYTAALNAWVRDGLKFRTDRQYSTIGGVHDWNWDLDDLGGEARYYKNVAPYIGRAMRENSGLRIFVGQGYFDFATPFFGAEYSLSRTGIPQERIHYRYYGSGHMMYVRDEDRSALSRDIREFIRGR